MRLETESGYSFDVSVNMFPDVETRPDQCSVGIVLSSPRSAHFVLPRAIERYAMEALVVHLHAMLDGLVEVVDPEAEDGYAEFQALSLRLRQVPSLTGLITFEISVNDCGCNDGAPFNSGAFLEFTLGRDDLAREIAILESQIWADSPIQATGKGWPAGA